MFKTKFIRELHTSVFVKIEGQAKKFKLYAYDEEFFNNEINCRDTKPRRLLIKYQGRFNEIKRIN